MTQPKSRDRMELDLFLALQSEPRPSGDEIVSAASQKSGERVLWKRSRRAYTAVQMARETLARLRRGDASLPRMAVVCLELLETLNATEEEDLKIVRRDILRDALAYRLGIPRQQAAVVGLAIAYGGVGGDVGCGGSADDSGMSTGHGGSCGIGHGGGAGGAGGGGASGGGGGASASPPAQAGSSTGGGYAPGNPGWAVHCIDLQTGFWVR